MGREYPILFAGPMVRAIFDGSKTQTRRVILPQPSHVENGRAFLMQNDAGYLPAGSTRERIIRCPAGEPGDLLWVREAWFPALKRTASSSGAVFPSQAQSLAPYGDPGEANPGWKPSGGWKRSIHMPRWASRLTLEITAVRVQRIQDISNDDARAEGVCGVDWGDGSDWYGPANYVKSFRVLWDSLNGKRGYPWSLNPWVWAVTFKRADSRE